MTDDRTSFSIIELSQLTGVSRSRIRSMIRTGKLPVVNNGHPNWQLHPRAVEILTEGTKGDRV